MAAKEHTIPEIIAENYKIKGQQTKIMQRMLFAIHKERRKQYLLQCMEKLQQEEDEQHEDYDPWAEDKEKYTKGTKKKELGKAMYDPQKVLPRYC